MVLFRCVPVCAIVLALGLSLAPSLGFAEGRPLEGRPLIAKAAASNPYRGIERGTHRPATRSSTTVIARWTEPPTFAIAPRTIGITLDANFFDRSAYAGPAQRGNAYNVRRKSS
jgi:hypothetical protein